MKSIQIDPPFVLPLFVEDAFQKLVKAGYTAYVVGGCVRDYLLGKGSKDYDLATNATPDQICLIFPNSVTVGKAFGVIKVPTGQVPPLLEIATFRKDLEYVDFRRPKGVVFSDPFEDAMRRDFTINALFYDPQSRQIIDFTSGFDDLKKGIVRAIGNPHERFKEDALRLLRAVRFTTRFGFHLESATGHAIQNSAALITQVSEERIRDELTLMWTGTTPEESFQLLSDLGLLKFVLPEMKSDPHIQFIVRRILEYLGRESPIRSMTLSWAGVLSRLKIAEVEQITSRLKMSRSEMDRVLTLISLLPQMDVVQQMREADLQRLFREEYFEDFVYLRRAQDFANNQNSSSWEWILKKYEELKNEQSTDAGSSKLPKLIDGNDLIRLGIAPGPEFSKILKEIEDLALEKKLSSHDEALEYVKRNFRKCSDAKSDKESS